MYNCIDAGRDGCPCALAASGDCLVCGRLNGRTCDDCTWTGSCIYTLYQQNGRHLTKNRIEQCFPIEDVRTYSPTFRVFVIKANKGFCQQAATAGAYVFVRGVGDDSWYDTPISVLKSEPNKGLIHLGVCGCGPKSKNLLSQKETLLVRGIYRNGLTGQLGLSETAENTFVFAKGIAIAPLRNFLDGGQRYGKFLKNLHLYIDLDKIGFDFFSDYFGDLPAASVSVCDFTTFDFASLCASPKDNVFTLASPYYVQQVQAAVGMTKTVVRPTEGNFCCGEGVCGACTSVDPKGNTIRRCKFVE